MKTSTPLTSGNQVTVANNKYQKALKQINKLININNSCKKQLITLQEGYDQLRMKYGELQQKCLALEEQNQNFIQNQGLPNMGKPTLSYQQHNSQISIPSFNQKNQGIQNKGRQNFSPLSIPGKQLQNTGTISQYVDTKRRLEQVEQKLVQKQNQIQGLNKKIIVKNQQNADLYKKYIEILNNYNKISNEIQIKGNTDNEKLEQQKSVLQNQLANQRSLNAKLTLQIQNFRKTNSNKLISSQQTIMSYTKNVSAGQIKVQIGGFQSRPPAVPYHQSYYSLPFQSIKSSTENNDRTDPFSEYYFKKVRDLESQMLKLKKQFTQKKSKYKNQVNKLKQELITKDADLKRLNGFINKQQYFIENYVIKNGIEEHPKIMIPDHYIRFHQYSQNPHNIISIPSSVSSSSSKPNHSQNKYYSRH